jgi:carboxymethylenebutenolidase
VGYGTGAWPAFLAATEHELGAAVSAATWHGSALPWTPGSAYRLLTPWLGLLGSPSGEATPSASEPPVVDDERRVYRRVVSYPGASGTFYRLTSGYYPVAFDSWQRTVEWLALRVAPAPTPLALQWEQRRAGSGAPGALTEAGRR